MRVSQLKSFIKDEELVGIALGQSVKKDMIKTTDIANNFLKLPEDTKSSCVERLFTAIRENPTKEAKRLQEKLISVIKNKYTAADKSDLWDKHCAALDKQNLEKKMERFVRKTGKATLFREKLHTKSVKLSELKDQRDLFVNNPKWKKKTKKLIDKASVHNEVDTFYKFTPLKEQHFIISSLPRSVDQAYRYMDTAIRTKKCNLFVSCNELKDGQKAKHKEKKCSDFWKNKEVLGKGFDGAKVEEVKEEVLKVGKAPAGYASEPRLIETTLSLEGGRKITHLHYDGWVDRTPCPDEDLLESLLERMEEISPAAGDYIGVNCHGGIGRTGAIVGSYYNRKLIKQHLADNPVADVGEIEVNIPKLISTLRGYKRGILHSDYHINTVYSRTIALYDKSSKARMPAPAEASVASGETK